MNWPNLFISVRRKSMSTKYEIEGEVIIVLRRLCTPPLYREPL